jgi:hypothetical protein
MMILDQLALAGNCQFTALGLDNPVVSAMIHGYAGRRQN